MTTERASLLERVEQSAAKQEQSDHAKLTELAESIAADTSKKTPQVVLSLLDECGATPADLRELVKEAQARRKPEGLDERLAAAKQAAEEARAAYVEACDAHTALGATLPDLQMAKEQTALRCTKVVAEANKWRSIACPELEVIGAELGQVELKKATLGRELHELKKRRTSLRRMWRAQGADTFGQDLDPHLQAERQSVRSEIESKEAQSATADGEIERLKAKKQSLEAEHGNW